MYIDKKFAIQLLIFSGLMYTTNSVYGDQGNPIRNTLLNIEKNYPQKTDSASIQQKNQRKRSETF